MGRKMRGLRWTATGLIVLACAVAPSLSRVGFSQGMVSTGAKPLPVRSLPPGLRAPAVDFRDLAAQAGLTAINVSGNLPNKTFTVEDTGNGAAIVDYDNDGLPDILLVTADQFEPRSPKPTLHLYHNLGGLRFEDVTGKAGLGHTGWGQGVCAGDIDNDGNVDVFITQWGQNVLLRNQGNGTFKDETVQRGLSSPGRRWSTGCAFLDYDRDGALDLFVSHYVDFDPATTPRPGPPSCVWQDLPVTCGPRGLPRETMSLYHNGGQGVFRDVSKQSGVELPKQYYGLTVLTGDFDNDGWPDVYVACDSTPSLLFRNKRDGTFEEIGVEAGVAYNENGQEQAGMGATAADYNRDGLLDILKTNFTNDTPTLYRNYRAGNFSDETVVAGLAVQTQRVSWGAAFLDFDNDGWKDILIANGHIWPAVDKAPGGETFRQPRSLYWNRRDNQFYYMPDTSGAAIRERHSSRGLAVGDLDNDGAVEAVIINMHEAPSLLKNFGEKGNALLVRVLTASGRDAIGARIVVAAGGRTEANEVRSGGYFISQGDLRVHFGLGAQTAADVTVRWLSGKTETFRAVAANQWITVREGKGIVSSRRFEPGAGGPRGAAP